MITCVVLLDVFLTLYTLALTNEEPEWLVVTNVVTVLLLGLEVVLRAVALGRAFFRKGTVCGQNNGKHITQTVR